MILYFSFTPQIISDPVRCHNVTKLEALVQMTHHMAGGKPVIFYFKVSFFISENKTYQLARGLSVGDITPDPDLQRSVG